MRSSIMQMIFLSGAKYYYGLEKYKMASFHLHQTCENYFYTLRLVHTLKNSKQQQFI